MAMKPERARLALMEESAQRKPEPTTVRTTPRPTTTKPEAVERERARLAKVKLTVTERMFRKATLACKHMMEIGRGDKEFERLWCRACGEWQQVVGITKSR